MNKSRFGVFHGNKDQLMNLVRVPHGETDIILSGSGDSLLRGLPIKPGDTRDATTAESLSVVDYFIEDPENPPESFPCNLLGAIALEMGRGILTSDGGVFVNPPADTAGNLTTDPGKLQEYLTGAKRIRSYYGGHAFIAPNRTDDDGVVIRDFGYAEPGSFKSSMYPSTSEAFSKSSLAMILEHCEGQSTILKRMAAPSRDPLKVRGGNFDSFLISQNIDEHPIDLIHLIFGMNGYGVRGPLIYGSYYNNNIGNVRRRFSYTVVSEKGKEKFLDVLKARDDFEE